MATTSKGRRVSLRQLLSAVYFKYRTKAGRAHDWHMHTRPGQRFRLGIKPKYKRFSWADFKMVKEMFHG